MKIERNRDQERAKVGQNRGLSSTKDLKKSMAGHACCAGLKCTAVQFCREPSVFNARLCMICMASHALLQVLST